MSFIVLNCQVVEWVDIFANPVFKNRYKLHRNHKGTFFNSLKISEMSLTILSSMHVLCRRADLVKKSTFLGIIILIFFACALRHCRVMTGYYVTFRYQAKPRTIYRLESVWNFKVTRFYWILPCKQRNWTSGPYSIEIINCTEITKEHL